MADQSDQDRGDLLRSLLGMKFWIDDGDCECGCSMGFLSGSGPDVAGLFCLNCQKPLRQLSREATRNLADYVRVFGRKAIYAAHLRSIAPKERP
jgi:hypothetical protein